MEDLGTIARIELKIGDIFFWPSKECGDYFVELHTDEDDAKTGDPVDPDSYLWGDFYDSLHDATHQEELAIEDRTGEFDFMDIPESVHVWRPKPT